MEPSAENSILTVPNDLLYLPAIQAFVSEVADKGGFSRRDTTMRLTAIEEAVVNVVRHAFEPDEKVTFQVIVAPGNSGITVIVKDKGLPYSPSLVPEYNAPSDIEGAANAGLSSHLIKKGVDEIFFHNLGRTHRQLIDHIPYRPSFFLVCSTSISASFDLSITERTPIHVLDCATRGLCGYSLMIF